MRRTAFFVFLIFVLAILLLAGYFLISHYIIGKGKMAPMPGVKEVLKKIAIAKIEPVDLAAFLDEDALMFLGFKNGSAQVKAILKSNLFEVAKQFKIDEGLDKNKNIAPFKASLDRFCKVTGMPVESDEFIDLLSYNSLFALYGKKTDTGAQFKYLVLAQPERVDEFKALKDNTEKEAFPLAYEGMQLFVTNRSFMVFKDDIMIVSNNFKKLKSAFDSASKKPYGAGGAKDLKDEKVLDMYKDRKGSYFYLYLPIELIIENLTGTGISPGRGIFANLLFDKIFFMSKLSSPAESELFMKIVKSDNENLNKIADITPRPYGALQFIPKEALFLSVNTNFSPAAWYAYNKSTQPSQGENIYVQAIFPVLDANKLLIFLDAKCFINYEKDLQPFLGSELSFAVNEAALTKRSKFDAYTLGGSYAVIIKSDKAGDFPKFIADKVDEVNNNYKKEVKLFMDEEVPELFTLLKIKKEALRDTAELYSIDFSRFVMKSNLKNDELQYSIVGDYIIVGSDIRPIIDAYYDPKGRLDEEKAFEILASKIGPIDKVGWLTYVNTAKLNTVLAKILSDKLPGALEKKAFEGGKPSEEASVQFLGWLGNILTTGERDGEWISTRSVFAVNDMSKDEWVNIFKVLGFKEKK